MNKIRMMINEFYAKYNIYPNKIILGRFIASAIIIEACETMNVHLTREEDILKIDGIDVELDFKHGYRISVMLELMEEINEHNK